MAHRCWIFLSMLALAPACDTSRETSPGPTLVTFSFRNTCDSAPTAAISLFVGTPESTHVAFARNWVVSLGETITVQVPSGSYPWEGATYTDYFVELAYSHWSPVVYDI